MNTRTFPVRREKRMVIIDFGFASNVFFPNDQIRYATTLQTKFKHDCQGGDRVGHFARCVDDRCGLHRRSRSLDNLGTGRASPAHYVQSQAPREGRWHRLPLLSYVRRDLRLCRHPSDRDMYDLPFANLDDGFGHKADSRQLAERKVD
jgi:hypothetical protein